MKTCLGCKKLKKEVDFGNYCKTKDGLRTRCKACYVLYLKRHKKEWLAPSTTRNCLKCFKSFISKGYRLCIACRRYNGTINDVFEGVRLIIRKAR